MGPLTMNPFEPYRRIAIAACLVALSGCTSTSQIDTALAIQPVAATRAPLPAPAEPGRDSATRGDAYPVQPAGAAIASAPKPAPADLVPQISVRNTGTFPNINEERAPALNQISEEERAAITAEMEALRAAHAAGRISASDYQARLAYLQRLAQSHSRDMVSRIEAQP